MKPMKKIDTYIYKLGLWAGAALSLTACVDEDLSDCPPNVEMREITVSYQIDLQHGVDPEFEAELLSLHLGFWNSPQNLYRDLVFQPEDMPEELFFKVTLPVDNYDHLAVANHNTTAWEAVCTRSTTCWKTWWWTKRPSPRTPSRLWPIRLSPAC